MRTKIHSLLVIAAVLIICTSVKAQLSDPLLNRMIDSVFTNQDKIKLRSVYGSTPALSDFNFLYEQANHYEKSLQYDSLASVLFYAMLTRDKYTVSWILYSVATVKMLNGEHFYAIEIIDKVFEFFRRANNRSFLSSFYFLKGQAYINMSMFDDAVSQISAGIGLSKQSGFQGETGYGYFILGDLYDSIGERDSAKAAYSLAMKNYEQINEAQGMANCCFRLSEMALRETDILTSLKYLDEAGAIYREIGDYQGLGNIYYTLGKIYGTINQEQKEKTYYDSAYVYYSYTADLLGRGNVKTRLGDLFLREEDYESAKKAYSEASAFLEKIGEASGLGSTYLGLGKAYMYLNEEDSAMIQFNRSLGYFERDRTELGKGNVWLEIGNMRIMARRFTDADTAFGLALKSYINCQNKLNMAWANFSLGFTGEQLGSNDTALIRYKTALSLLDQVRDETGFSEMKLTFQERMYSSYSTAIGFMLRNGFYRDAQQYAEAVKSRTFLDQIAEKKTIDFDKEIDPQLRFSRDNIINTLANLKTYTQQVRDDSQRNMLLDSIKNYENHLEEVIRKIRFSNPRFAAVRYFEPAGLEQIQQALREDEIILSYLQFSEAITTFIIDKKGMEVTIKDVSSAVIDSLTESALALMKATALRGAEEIGDEEQPDSLLWQNALAELHEILITPASEFLTGKKAVVIIPSGKLSVIPFEMLITGRENGQVRFLTEDYTISYSQSSTLFSLYRSELKPAASRKITSFVAFGDPVYDYDSYKAGLPEKGVPGTRGEDENLYEEQNRESFLRLGEVLNRLPATSAEISTISDIMTSNGINATAFLRADATEENAKSEVTANADIISFACHGLLSDEYQSLALSRIPGAKEDGFFTIEEIMTMNWKAGLVVLSACKTGKGKIRRGEGVMGLSRAVMYAGAAAALVSLWSVEDNATKELMINFFSRYISQNMNKTEALRMAKLDMIKSGKYSNPFYWAAFIMYGE
ncbi:MAG: CHAT domain-containing protein [Ignavibacteriaceae bacterium]|nr:CHAT domain-containing protein [Ignavibacteriaceae bacterium]